jgi:hypothetical protein
MFLHDSPLIFGELSRFEQNGIRYTHFTNIISSKYRVIPGAIRPGIFYSSFAYLIVIENKKKSQKVLPTIKSR